MLVLRIHTDGRLVLTKLVGLQYCLEGVVVTLVTNHIQRLYGEYLLIAVLVEAYVNLLQTNGIVKALFVDNILDVI
jgi:hypothetical protein